MTLPTFSDAPPPHPCLICEAQTHYFFSKTYGAYPGSPYTENLKIDYWRCVECGFVISKTHQDMPIETWKTLNTSWHHHFEQNPNSRATNQPPYADQALALKILSINKIVDINNSLDYAAGYGTFSKLLSKYFDTNINIYDRFVQQHDNCHNYLLEQQLGHHSLVINSAMFEHIITRESLNDVNDLVARDGVLMLHTLICENIPKDPDWFYISPLVHTAFHTNKSMAKLMEQWDYAASVYSPQAKSWFLFKKNHPQLHQLEKKISNINLELQTKYFYYTAGFLDYWKGF